MTSRPFEALSELARVLDRTAEAVARVDASGQYTYVNEAYARLVGLSEEDLLRRKWHDIVDLENQEEELRAYKQMQETGMSESQTFARRPDGRFLHKEVIAVRLQDEQGNFNGHYRFVRDISRRKQAELERDRLFALSPDILCIADLDGKVLRLNPAFETILGYATERFVGKRSILVLVHPADRGRVAEQLERARQGHEPLFGAARFRARNGTYRWLSWRAQRDPESGLVFVTARDESELRRVHEALRQSESFSHYLTASAPLLIYATAPDGTCSYVNPRIEEFFGKSAAAPERCPWAESAHPDDRERYLALFQKSVNTRVKFEVELRHQRADGTYRWVSWVAIPRYATNGDFLGFVACGTDISERKEAERKLAAARDEAQRIAEARAQVLSEVSHEIRTPLSIIRGFAQSLTIGPAGLTDERHRQSLTKIINATDSVVRLLNSFLDLSKIEAGKTQLDVNRLNLRRHLSDTVEFFREACDEKALSLGLSIDDEVPAWVLADGGKLSQILRNLLGNAIKFTAAGSIIVEASVGKDVESVGTILIKVIDTGTGIPADRQSALFVPYEQADETISRKYGGSGLGLAICRKLLDQLGGQIGVESLEGRGSTFWYSLPLPEAIVPSILLIEDDPVAQEMTKAVLLQQGFEVLAVATGVEALALIEDCDFDIVLTDYQLSDMTGPQIVSQLRERMDVAPSVLAITGHATAEKHQECRSAGISDVLVKPVQDDLLLTKIFAVLRQDLLREREPLVARLRKFSSLGGPKFVRQMVDVFREAASQRLERLREGVLQGDAQTVEKEAHGLKSACAEFGASRTARLAARMEKLGAAGNLVAAARLLPRFEAQHARLVRELGRSLS